MPIKPENRNRYPANWKSHIRPRILNRAGNACEGSPDYPDCRAANYCAHQDTGSKVVLTIAHLDHIPENCDGMETGGDVLPLEKSNLRAWCQRCHLGYDKEHHAQTAYASRRDGRVVSDLFAYRGVQNQSD